MYCWLCAMGTLCWFTKGGCAAGCVGVNEYIAEFAGAAVLDCHPPWYIVGVAGLVYSDGAVNMEFLLLVS